MENWIPSNVQLNGSLVDLIPLEEEHFQELTDLAASEPKIWKHYIFDGTNRSTFERTLENAMERKEDGSEFPYVIYHKERGQLIGSTRFMDIHSSHKNLEIGFTWLHPDYWGSAINLECKILLLTFCFEELKTIRVQLKTDELNTRSRKAIEKIGGKFEGLIRNQMIREDGTIRTSAMYSIIPEEWAELKRDLVARLENTPK